CIGMSPQFVDFNADGHVDIVAGTFDGSPHVAFGSKEGFAQPSHILDSNGKRIVFNQLWDYELKKWVYNDPEDKAQCTSAFAYDWDMDGDFDLVLGDYKGGRVFVNFNGGSNKEPAFTAKSHQVWGGGKPIDYEGGLATMRMVDWDGDGRDDLMIGTMGVSYGTTGGSSLDFYRNIGERGAPAFAKSVTIYQSPAAKEGEFAGPGGGFYFDATDYDGDGDLDLLIGGKATMLPQTKDLSDEQKKRVEELQGLISTNSKARSAIYTAAREEAGDTEAEDFRKKYSEAVAKRNDELSKLNAVYAELSKELRGLVPLADTQNLVWLIENLSKAPEKAARR
ncbi:MAG: VCBS repeat-containing protein, partial [Planctomycetes bacterium]|nr:VCBS repeat-containing protein [Planctomycetota bacterium]